MNHVVNQVSHSGKLQNFTKPPLYPLPCSLHIKFAFISTIILAPQLIYQQGHTTCPHLYKRSFSFLPYCKNAFASLVYKEQEQRAGNNLGAFTSRKSMCLPELLYPVCGRFCVSPIHFYLDLEICNEESNGITKYTKAKRSLLVSTSSKCWKTHLEF